MVQRNEELLEFYSNGALLSVLWALWRFNWNLIRKFEHLSYIYFINV